MRIQTCKKANTTFENNKITAIWHYCPEKGTDLH